MTNGSVWHDSKIAGWGEDGGVKPFAPELVNPTSLDLRMGNMIRLPHEIWSRFSTIDIQRHIENGTIEDLPRWGEAFEFETFWMMPRQFALCHSLEFINMPADAVSFLFSKSSTGRIGLEHLHAGLGETEWTGQWTWELHNVAPWPIKLEAGKKVMQQVMLKVTDVPLRTYRETGRYNGQTGPTPAKV